MELYLWLWSHLPWTWWVMIGTTVTFGVGWIVSVSLGKSAKPESVPG
jgi:hypothetical protein